MRKLTLKALSLMEGQKVMVHDCEYDEYDQECEVKITWTTKQNAKKKNKYDLVIEKLWLENEEFIFEYEGNKCKNGEFYVYVKDGD